MDSITLNFYDYNMKMRLKDLHYLPRFPIFRKKTFVKLWNFIGVSKQELDYAVYKDVYFRDINPDVLNV